MINKYLKFLNEGMFERKVYYFLLDVDDYKWLYFNKYSINELTVNNWQGIIFCLENYQLKNLFKGTIKVPGIISPGDDMFSKVLINMLKELKIIEKGTAKIKGIYNPPEIYEIEGSKIF